MCVFLHVLFSAGQTHAIKSKRREEKEVVSMGFDPKMKLLINCLFFVIKMNNGPKAENFPSFLCLIQIKVEKLSASHFYVKLLL